MGVGPVWVVSFDALMDLFIQERQSHEANLQHSGTVEHTMSKQYLTGSYMLDWSLDLEETLTI